MKTTSDMNIRVPGLLKNQLVHVGIASISPGDYMIGIGAKWCNSVRHKEVEAALEAGFNPDYTDSFGGFAKKGAVTARHGESL